MTLIQQSLLIYFIGFFVAYYSVHLLSFTKERGVKLIFGMCSWVSFIVLIPLFFSILKDKFINSKSKWF